MYDVQAEAEYEALKGLLEWRIQQEQVEERARIQECLNQSTALPKVPPVPVMTRILECINEFTALPRVIRAIRSPCSLSKHGCFWPRQKPASY